MSESLNELRELCDAVFDGRADRAQVERLEALVFSSSVLRRCYAEYAHQHAALAWTALSAPLPTTEATTLFPVTPLVAIRSQHRSRSILKWVVAAGMLAAFTFAMWPGPTVATPRFATLERLQSARWANSTLPIGEGARLGVGRMELSDGMATIDFDKGVKLVLEAPAVFELIDANQCRLHQGKIRAEVRPGGEGFVVRTPTATLIDRGTVFGVTVQVGGVSDLMVFKGRVDAEHAGTGQWAKVETGSGLRMTTGAIEVIPDENAPLSLPGAPPVESSMPNTIQISTAIGRGMDAYVQSIVPPADRRSDTLLLLKNNNRRFGGERFYEWHRKAYLRFDVSLLGDQAIASATFELHADRSGMGFASHCPDATFTVFGLTDEALDGWDSEQLRWQNAPANFPDGRSLDASRTIELGQFTIPQGQCTGRFGIQTPELVDFLKRDTNGLVTLVVVRETIGNGVSDLVHGFASRRHPTLPAPMLRIGTAEVSAALQPVVSN